MPLPAIILKENLVELSKSLVILIFNGIDKDANVLLK